MTTATDIIDAIGRKELGARLKKGPTTISAAYVAGVMPSSWFPVVEEMSAAVGVDCPRSAFSFIKDEAAASEGAAA